VGYEGAPVAPAESALDIGFETQTPTTTLKERVKAAHATVVPMFSSDGDTGTLWRAGEMGYGRNPIVTAKMMAERPPGKPQEGGYAYFLGPDQELIEAGGGRKWSGREDLNLRPLGPEPS
jgi:hypothetical protein